MRLTRCFRALAMLAALSAASFAQAQEEWTRLDKVKLFAGMEMPSLDTILQTQSAEHMGYQDQLVRVRGSFVMNDREKVLAALKAYGFTISTDMMFVTGDDDDWWKLDGAASNEIKLGRWKPGENDLVKLYEMNDGRGVFLFELGEW